MLKVACYRSWSEVRELRPHWNRLLQLSGSDTVFLTWQWIETWWNNYGGQRSPFVLVACEGEEIVAIAPLFRDPVRRYGRLWQRLLLVGDGSHDSDYLDIFALLGRETEAMNAFGEFLTANSGLWDWIELNGPREHSPTVAAISEYGRQMHWHCESLPIPCATLPLTGTWEQYLAGMAPRFRTKVRAALATLKDYVRSEPQPCSLPEQVDQWLPVLFDLHTRRWGTRGKTGVFGTTAKRSFYADLSRAALKEGWLAFHRVDWAERPLAMQYGLVYRNRFHLLQEGYDPEFSELRPGLALRAWSMRHWRETSLEEYDFLAGVSDYKLDWGAGTKFSQRVVISGQPLGRLVASGIPRLRETARERISHMIPAGMLSWRKRIRSQRKAAPPTTNSGATGPRRDRPIRVRRFLSSTYSSTPVGRWGRSVASHYVWASRNGNKFPLRRRAQPVCQIFQYHRVDDGRDPFFAALPTAAFRAQMEYIAANFPLMTLDQLARGEFPEGEPYSVAVTFDDGYRDNFLSAFPILKDLRVPATVFLTTGYVDSGTLPWYDQVRLAFKLTTRSKVEIEGLSNETAERTWELRDTKARAGFAERVLQWLRGMQGSERSNAMHAVYHSLGVPADLNLPNQMLRWEEIRQMAASGITFGAHTVNHPVLSKIPDADIRREILDSKQTIENRLQKSVAHFAYPFGQPFDFNSQAKSVIQAGGFKTAVTTVWGLNEPSADPYELRRFTPWQRSIAEFRLQLDWYRFSDPGSAQFDGEICNPRFSKEVS